MPTLVQKTGNAATATTVTATLGAPTAAGNLLVVYYGDGSLNSVATLPGGWSVAATNPDVTSGCWSAMGYYTNNPGGITTVLVTGGGGSDYLGVYVEEWSGVSTISPLDQVGSLNSRGTLTTISVPTAGSTATSTEAVFAGFLDGAGTNPGTYSVGGSGYTLADTDTVNHLFATSWQNLNAAGVLTAILNWTTSVAAMDGMIATYRPATTTSGGYINPGRTWQRRYRKRRMPVPGIAPASSPTSAKQEPMGVIRSW